jgi:hypothetical protein
MRRLIAIALLTAYVGLASAEPVVLLTTPIEVPDFRDNLDADRVKVETALTAKLAELTRERYPVFNWQTANAGPAPEAQLTLALTEKRAQGQWTEIRLTWRAKVGATEIQMPDLPAIPIYGGLDIREMHDAAALSVFLNSKLETWFGEASNRKEFSKSFVNSVPVARNVRVEGATRSIALPFLMSSAKVGRHSKLEVHFTAKANGANSDGVILVSELFEGVSDSRRQTLASVSTFQFGTGDIVNGWSPQIPTLLNNPVRSLLFFEDYVFSPAGAVSNGLMGAP